MRSRLLMLTPGLVAAALVLGAAAASAQTTGVMPLPSGCIWAYSTIPTTTAPGRPVFRSGLSWSRQGVGGVPTNIPPPLRRNVSFTYSISGMDRVLPTNFAGTFHVWNTRVQVFGGYGTPFGPVLQRDHSMPTSSGAAGAGSTVQTVDPYYGTFDNTWMMRVISSGWQVAAPGATPQAATVAIDCTLNIRSTTAPPPVFNP
jgi:hypothetical protein